MVLEDGILKYASGLENVSMREEKGMRIFSRGERIFALYGAGY